MADEKQPEAKAEKVELNLIDLIPEEFATKFKSGEFKDIETAQKALQENYKVVFRRQGYGDVKTVQAGTHKAVQSKLAAVAKDLEIELVLTDQTQTADVIEQLKTKIAEIKNAAPKAGLSEDEKKQLADIQTLKKGLEQANIELKKAKDETAQVLTKAEQEKAGIVKSLHAEKVLSKAIADSASLRNAAINDDIVNMLFEKQYTIDVKLTNGKADGYELRTKDGQLAMKNANDVLKINEAMQLIYKANNIEAKQPAQSTPVGEIEPSKVTQNSGVRNTAEAPILKF